MSTYSYNKERAGQALGNEPDKEKADQVLGYDPYTEKAGQALGKNAGQALGSDPDPVPIESDVAAGTTRCTSVAVSYTHLTLPTKRIV